MKKKTRRKEKMYQSQHLKQNIKFSMRGCPVKKTVFHRIGVRNQ